MYCYPRRFSETPRLLRFRPKTSRIIVVCMNRIDTLIFAAYSASNYYEENSIWSKIVGRRPPNFAQSGGLGWLCSGIDWIFVAGTRRIAFRHSIAVHMLECGESIAVIKAFLGHASIAATMIYASVTPEIANRYLKDRDIGIDNLQDAPPHRGQPELLSFLRKAKD